NFQQLVGLDPWEYNKNYVGAAVAVCSSLANYLFTEKHLGPNRSAAVGGYSGPQILHQICTHDEHKSCAAIKSTPR
ncbi:MAG TPA: hypothetical protein VLA51_00180, partial [Paracoccaceae bacterium]|nr:hypothetical protein [Paracoccaceae bacterium]